MSLSALHTRRAAISLSVLAALGIVPDTETSACTQKCKNKPNSKQKACNKTCKRGDDSGRYYDCSGFATQHEAPRLRRRWQLKEESRTLACFLDHL